MATIATLPNDVFRLFLERLPICEQWNAAQVCQQWHDITFDMFMIRTRGQARGLDTALHHSRWRRKAQSLLDCLSSDRYARSIEELEWDRGWT